MRRDRGGGAGLTAGRRGRSDFTSAGRPAKTVFFGSGAFGIPTLEVLASDPGVELVGVVSAPDRPAGRGGHSTAVPVAARTSELGLPLLQPERLRSAEALESVVALGAALGVLADYGQIVPAALIEAFAAGILNVHPSLLPRHRGASPIPAAILRGDTESGVTLIRMDAGLDTGAIVAAERLPLTGSETTPELEPRLAEIGAGLVRRALGPWLRGALVARAQDERLATTTRPLRREDGRLDAGRTAAALERQVRAYQPWPGSFLEAPERLLVWRAEAAPSEPDDRAGTLVRSGDTPALVTVEGRLRLIEVQSAGGRRMTGAELLRGRPGLVERTGRSAPGG